MIEEKKEKEGIIDNFTLSSEQIQEVLLSVDDIEPERIEIPQELIQQFDYFYHVTSESNKDNILHDGLKCQEYHTEDMINGVYLWPLLPDERRQAIAIRDSMINARLAIFKIMVSTLDLSKVLVDTTNAHVDSENEPKSYDLTSIDDLRSYLKNNNSIVYTDHIQVGSVELLEVIDYMPPNAHTSDPTERLNV